MFRELENKLYSLGEIKDTFDNIDGTVGTGLIKFDYISTHYLSGMHGDAGIERVLKLVEDKFYSEGNKYLASIGEIHIETDYQLFKGENIDKHYLTLKSWYTDPALDTLMKKTSAGKANISFESEKNNFFFFLKLS